MIRRIFFAFLVATLSGAGLLNADEHVRLTKRQQETLLNNVVPAYQRGNLAELVQALSPMIGKLDDERMQAANELLSEMAIPPIDRMITDARLKMAELNLTAQLPTPNVRELFLTLGTLKKHIDTVFADQDRHSSMRDPLEVPSKLTDYKKLFWEIHVLENRLRGLVPIARHAAELSTRASRMRQDSLSAEQRELAKSDLSNIVAQVERRYQELEEREIELRMYRIEEAEDTLATSEDAKAKFLAVYVLDLDGALIKQFYRERAEFNASRKVAKGESTIEFIRQDLSDPSIVEMVDESVNHAKESAGDLVEKARLLYTGMHWWLRGRYGAGPEGFGLLKNKVAIRSLEDQFPLYMPMVTPKPKDPGDVRKLRVPEIDRRHHYTWAVEYRPIQVSVNGHNLSKVTKGSTQHLIQTTHLSRFY